MCLDELPPDYICVDSCRDLALNGFCASDWAFFSNCFPNTPSGKIEDDCRLSCNNCGKYLRWLQYTQKDISWLQICFSTKIYLIIIDVGTNETTDDGIQPTTTTYSEGKAYNQLCKDINIISWLQLFLPLNIFNHNICRYECNHGRWPPANNDCWFWR